MPHDERPLHKFLSADIFFGQRQAVWFSEKKEVEGRDVYKGKNYITIISCSLEAESRPTPP
ncbi:hypothetical protein VCV18_002435 [Metarhizium anisopliae]